MSRPVVVFQNWIEPEDQPVQGSFSNPKDVKWVLAQLKKGNDAAWCYAVTLATVDLRGGYGPVGDEEFTFEGRATLGGCAYKSENDLWKNLRKDQEAEALEDLFAVVRKEVEYTGDPVLAVSLDALLEAYS